MSVEPADYVAAFAGMRTARSEALVIISAPDFFRVSAKSQICSTKGMSSLWAAAPHSCGPFWRGKFIEWHRLILISARGNTSRWPGGPCRGSLFETRHAKADGALTTRAREGHRGSIAEYCDGSKPTRAACALMMFSYTTVRPFSRPPGHPIVGCRLLCVLLNLPPQLRHRLARYKTLLNDTLRRWRPIDSRVSAAIDPRCPSRARSQGPSGHMGLRLRHLLH